MKSLLSVRSLGFTTGLLIFFSTFTWAETIRVSNFKPVYQGSFPWCWASVSEMALYQRAGIRKPSCELVSEALQLNCCGIFSQSGCVVPGRVEPVIQKNGFDLAHFPASIANVIELIRGDRLAILRLDNIYPGRTGHVVVVYGIENVDQPDRLRFLIYDPAKGHLKESPIRISRLYELGRRSAYRWVATMAIAN